MNILWINKITDAEYWGSTQIGLSKALVRRGHKVILVMAKNAGENKTTNKDIIYLPTLSSSLLSGIFFGLIVTFYLPFFIRRKKLDIIIIDGTSVWLPFAFIFKIMNIPIMMDIRTLPIEKKRSILFDICLHLSKFMTYGLTTITPELKSILLNKYNFQDKKIGIWPSGADIQDYSNNIDNKGNSKKFVLIHHGSYKNVRGVDNLIKSIGELDNSIKKNITLMIVGVHKEDQKDLLDFCKNLGVTEQIKLIPMVEFEKIPYYIKSSDVGVIPLPPDYEYWKVSVPLKTIECMAMGKPILVTNIPFHKRLFEMGKCGLLLDTNEPKALSDAITYLYNNKEILNEMGKIGKEIVKNNYTWDIIAFNVENFIKNILADF